MALIEDSTRIKTLSNGKWNVALVNLEKLARACKVSMLELFRGI